MRKALLIVAMLLSVVPVMATTTITAYNEGVVQTPDGNYMATVRIAYSSDVNVRAFALDINIDSDGNRPNFQRIRDFNKGEANGTSGHSGYGIFPSRFRDFVNPLTPDACYADPNYNPTTAWNEPGTTSHTWGMGYPQMIVEMGTLYAGDANKPPLSGTLFRFDVNSWGASGIFNVTVAADTLRGGVVNSDGNSIAANFVGTSITFPSGCVTPLNEIGQLQAVAVGVWNGQGFASTSGVGVVDCNDSNVGKVLSYSPTTCVPTSTTINYTYGINPTVPNIVTPVQTKAQAEAAIVAAYFTVGVETGVASDAIPINQVTSQVQTAGTQLPCGSAIDFSYVCHRVTCATCLGDVTGDGRIKLNDLSALVTLLNTAGSPYSIPSTSCLYNPCGDLNGDGKIKLGDYSALVTKLNGYGSPYNHLCP